MTILLSAHRALRALPKRPSRSRHASSAASDLSRQAPAQIIPKHTTTPQATCRLPSADRAAFAVSSRLLSSIVTEGLLPAVYIPLRDCSVATGICVILAKTPPQQTLSTIDVFAIVPLHHQPILKPVRSSTSLGKSLGRSIWLLDPFDMLPCVLELRESAFRSGHPPVSQALLRYLFRGLTYLRMIYTLPSCVRSAHLLRCVLQCRTCLSRRP